MLLINHQLQAEGEESIRFVTSPFFDARPNEEISLLVVHNISLPPEQFDTPYIEDLFLGRLDPNAHPYFKDIYQLKVSAHCLIKRDGSIIQFVPFNQRAWHAGLSQFEGRERCNDFSIGIELEGSDHQAFSEIQYQVLAALTRTLCAYYTAITPDRITGHSHISPGRKTDPGPYFNWNHYRELMS